MLTAGYDEVLVALVGKNNFNHRYVRPSTSERPSNMDNQIEIRRATTAMIGLFDNVADDVFDAPIDQERLRLFLVDRHHIMVIAIWCGQIIGQSRAVVLLSPDSPDCLYIDNLGVKAEFRRRGIGGKLVDELFRWGSEFGCITAWLATEPENVAARMLYLERGACASATVVFDRDLT